MAATLNASNNTKNTSKSHKELNREATSNLTYT